MNRTIMTYVLSQGTTFLSLPSGATVLGITVQFNMLYLSVLASIGSNEHFEQREFLTIRTGETVTGDKKLHYIGLGILEASIGYSDTRYAFEVVK